MQQKLNKLNRSKIQKPNAWRDWYYKALKTLIKKKNPKYHKSTFSIAK